MKFYPRFIYVACLLCFASTGCDLPHLDDAAKAMLDAERAAADPTAPDGRDDVPEDTPDEVVNRPDGNENDDDPSNHPPAEAPDRPDSPDHPFDESVDEADPLAALSDDFEDPSQLQSWRRVMTVEEWPIDQLERLDIGETTPGRLTMMPHTSAWYRDYRGALLFKPVTGNFIASTQINVGGRRGGAPNSRFSLGGLMVRAPRDITPATWQPGGEDYIFLSLGAGRQPGRYMLEVKTTDDSDSDLELTRGAAEATIQVARIGSVFIVLVRLPGQDWQIHRRYHRPDMPATLQVGMTAYTDWDTVDQYDPADHNTSIIHDGHPDLVAQFEWFNFRTPTAPAELRGIDLTDGDAVSDALLLGFLTP